MTETKMSEKCKIIKPDSEINKLLIKTCVHPLKTGYVEVGEEKICLPLIYKDMADPIEELEVRDSDIFVVTHPKTGKNILYICI